MRARASFSAETRFHHGRRARPAEGPMAMRRMHIHRHERPLPRAALIGGALALWLALGVISQAAFQLLG